MFPPPRKKSEKDLVFFMPIYPTMMIMSANRLIAIILMIMIPG
jgi:hypothetical protein